MDTNPYKTPKSLQATHRTALPLRLIGCVLFGASIVIAVVAQAAASALFTVIYHSSSPLSPPVPNPDIFMSVDTIITRPHWSFVLPLVLSATVGLVLMVWPRSQGSWIGAVVIGVTACLLTGTLLGIAGMLFLPELVDDRSVVSNIYGIAIWLVSIGVGVSQVVRYRPRQ